MKNIWALSIREKSQVGEARRLAAKLAHRLDFNEIETGKVAIVVSEAAGNLAKHAYGGQIIIRSLKTEGSTGLEILALDKGPGMDNVAECMHDGFSTTGGPGTGLGAIARLSALFDIHSVPELGTAILARLWSRPQTHNPRLYTFDLGVVCLPKSGEEFNGDGWKTIRNPTGGLILLVDGLGHGPEAYKASREAIKIFIENPQLGLTGLIQAAHTAMRHTRGAAMAVTEIDLHHQQARFAGIGNIAGAIVTSNGRQNMVSLNGTVGQQIRKILEFTYQWPKGALLIIYSDGLAMHWGLDQYPGLIRKHPGLIAGVLYRDYARGYDDVTVLVIKCIDF